jgi:peroxiredoxin
MSQAALSQDRCASSRRCWFERCRTSIVLLLLCLLANSGAEAVDEGFSLGDTLPAFSQLVAVDGTEWSTDQFAKSEVLIIAFTCNRCPYAVDYEARLNLLHKQYGDSKSPVKLLVINSNYGPDESLKRMASRAKELHFEFTYVKDGDQSVARRMGAIYTPEFFVFDQDRRLVYKGALDDATNAVEVKTHYINDAVAAVLAGTPIKTAEAGARGCTIRFKRRRPVRRTP